MTEFKDITAVVITRGDTDLKPILATLPYGEILVNQNGRISEYVDGEMKEWGEHQDSKVYNRFITASLATNDVIYFQDDDVRISDHQGLLDAFNARQHLGDWVANTQPGLDEAQGYWDLALVGCGSIVPRDAWLGVFARYRAEYGPDDRFDLDCDFIFGTLSHWVKVDLGLDVLDVASADNRLWRQPGQMEAKHASINKARALRRIVLTMLTKDEQENVVRALSSARPLYDKVLIHDTGSTDDTVLEVSRFCTAEGIPFRIVENVPFEGFGANRNRLIADAHAEADYMLLMDADEEFVDYSDAPTAVHRPELFCDAYVLRYAGEIDYAQPRILYSNFPWRFDDATRHAALNGGYGLNGRHPVGCDMQEPKILHHGVDNNTPERFQKDIDGLTDDIVAGRDVPRSRFMRGKAFEGMAYVTGDKAYLDAAINDYHARIDMSRGDEESYYAHFRLGCLLVEHRGELMDGAYELLMARAERPGRNESLRALAAYLTAVADATPYPTEDMIIVHRDLYHDHPLTEGA